MGKALFYTQTNEDLERVVRKVVNELRKTEFFESTPLNSTADRLTQKQAAKFLGISVPTLIEHKKKYKIPYYQVGRSIFYSKAELLNISKKNRS